MKEFLRKWSNWIIGVVAVAFVVGMWSWVHEGLPPADANASQWTIAGTRGDAFGAINALFSGLAFAGFLLALKMQRDELAEQRNENREGREEAKRHTEATDRMRIASLLGVMAQINTTLGQSNNYGNNEIKELRRILDRAKTELGWDELPNTAQQAQIASSILSDMYGEGSQK